MLFSEWKKLIKEGLSKIVFHGTNINNLLSILKNNKFLLSPVSNISDELHNKFYFFSVSRIKYGGYMRGGERVNIVLDGEKLSNNYKAVSVDYWGSNFSDKSVKNKKLNTQQRNRYDENEERIISDNDEIENAVKYIKEIHILIKEKNRDEIIGSKNFFIYRNIKKYCDYYNIPCFFYYNTDEDEFKVLRQKNGELTDIFTSKTIDKLTGIIKLFNDKENINKPEDITKEKYGLNYNQLIFDIYRTDLITSIENDIGNNKNDILYRKKIKKFFSIMKKFKSKNIKNFVIKLEKYFNNKFNEKDLI